MWGNRYFGRYWGDRYWASGPVNATIRDVIVLVGALHISPTLIGEAVASLTLAGSAPPSYTLIGEVRDT